MMDFILRDCQIIDGTGEPPYTGDIAIKDGIIAKIVPHIKETAAKEIDVAGETVTPGFIDIHRHADAHVFKDGFGESELRQGITTIINGNCGLSIVPCPENRRGEILRYLNPITGPLPEGIRFSGFSEYKSLVESRRLPLNVGMLVGSGTLRIAVNGFAGGELSEDAVKLLHSYLKDAMKGGAFGVSIGLMYMPDAAYTAKDMARALAPMAKSGLPLVAHIRGEGDLLVNSVREVLETTRLLDIPLHISHYKCVGKRNWGHLLEKATALIMEARWKGQKVTADVYPWTAGASQLTQTLPPSFLEGGMEHTTQLLRDEKQRERCRRLLSTPQPNFDNFVDAIGWESIVISNVRTEAGKACIGKNMVEIAAEQGKDPLTAVFDLLVQESCDVAMVNHICSEKDLETIIG